MAGVSFITEAPRETVEYYAYEEFKIPSTELRIVDIQKSVTGRRRVQVEAHDFKWEIKIRKLYFFLRDQIGYKSQSGSILTE